MILQILLALICKHEWKNVHTFIQWYVSTLDWMLARTLIEANNKKERWNAIRNRYWRSKWHSYIVRIVYMHYNSTCFFTSTLPTLLTHSLSQQHTSFYHFFLVRQMNFSLYLATAIYFYIYLLYVEVLVNRNACIYCTTSDWDAFEPS